MIQIKTPTEISKMLKACELSAQALALAGRSITPGMSTWELDKIIHDFIISKGATPSFLGYGGFKGSACISINEELIHGIPSKSRIIKEGDIVTVDVGACIGGYHGDNARTFPVGKISEEAENLLKVTEESLYEGIKMAVEGNRIGDISHAVESWCVQRGYSVVKKYVGHGVGKNLHEDPEVPNYGRPGRGPRLAAGMTIAIEPMINAGTEEIRVLSDNWTVVTADGKLCAHFEHTIAITKSEPLIMTLESH
ncbi:MAG: type I methionyl aminopeptidase [Clostridiales bacterium]|mgnify:CR=1 FL=1|nr:type I methionyl aminopeptidase [Clostridiales bacterium]